MKTEDFDDAIRRKVESINYSFTEKDIDRIQEYSGSKNSIRSLWYEYGVFSLFCLLGLSMSGLFYIIHLQAEEQKFLTTKLDSLQKSFTEITQNNNSVKKQDTVFIVKYISREESDFFKENINSVTNTKNKQTRIEKNNSYEIEYSERINGHSENSIIKDKFSKAATKWFSYKVKNNSLKASGSIKDISDQIINGIDIPSLKTVELSSDKDIYLIASSNKTVSKEESSFEEQASLKNVPKVLNKDSTFTIDSLPKLAKEVIPRKDLIKNKKTKKYLSLRNLQYRAGLSVEKANRQFGIGILGELLFSKRFSISAGIKYLNINDHFHDSDDFNKQTNKDFTDVTSQLIDTSNLSDITMNYMILQIPVALNYSIPFKNNYSFLLSAGTDLDIYSNLNIKYQQTGSSNQDIEKNTSLKIQYHPVLFNNLVLSAGLQKEWEHFALQASPFISPQLKTVDYKQSNLYGGLRIKLLYKF